MKANLLEIVGQVRRHLAHNGRVSLRMLRRQFELDDDTLAEIIEELVDIQRVARREENALAWLGNATPSPLAEPPPAGHREPLADTPKHLAASVQSARSIPNQVGLRVTEAISLAEALEG